MNKKTRRQNYSLSRIKFWNAIRLHLDTFTQISDDQPYLTSEDRINLREIYYMLSLSRNMAEYRESFHKDKFKDGQEYVRWDRVDGYLAEIGFRPQMG